jgi:general secretion pathway protein N
MNSKVISGNAMSQPVVRFPWRWLLTGVLAYLVFLLATFPAARLATRLQTKGFLTAGVTGTIWNGSAAAIQFKGLTLGPTEWHISVWRLLSGKISVDLHTKRDDGYVDANVRVGFGDTIAINNLRGTVPVNAIAGLGLMPGGPAGWNGTLQLNVSELALTKGWPTLIKGSIEAANLVGPPQQPTQLGSYRVTFPAPNSPATTADLRGAVQSMDDSPLDVIGTITLNANRQYVIDAQVATRASASAAIVKTLQYLGPPDAQGRRPLSLAGSF